MVPDRWRVSDGVCLAAAVTSIPPLYRRGDAPVAALARLARPETPEDSGPLILYPAGALDELWRPTALFYSGRRIREAYTADELAEATRNGLPRRAIVLQEQIGPLSAGYDVRVLAEAAPFAYAMITRTAKD